MGDKIRFPKAEIVSKHTPKEISVDTTYRVMRVYTDFIKEYVKSAGKK